MHPGIWSWILVFAMGLGIGGVYFGGLWLTLRQLLQWQHPYLWLTGSQLGRLAMVLGGGAWLLSRTATPPLPTILLMGAGICLSWVLLVTQWVVSLPSSTGSSPAIASSKGAIAHELDP